MVNVFQHWDPLEECWVGDTWPEEFYSDLQPDVRDVFARITEIARRDLDQLSDTLTSLGVKVRRPHFDSDSGYYRDTNGFLIRPPVPIRDDNLVLGNDFMFHLRLEYLKDPWQHALDEYKQAGVTVHTGCCLEKYGYIEPPSIVRCGKDILIDKDSHAHSWELMERDFIPFLIERGYRVSVAETDGHVDSVFSLMKPGHILTSHWKEDYNEYPNWDVHHIPEDTLRDLHSSINHVDNSLAWWVKSEQGYRYPVFNDYVAKNAKDWIGNPLETVYLVNCLVVNEELVLTTGEPDADTKAWFKKIGMEYIPITFEAGTFFDSGIHCATVDIRRKGEMQDFFSERTKTLYEFE